MTAGAVFGTTKGRPLARSVSGSLVLEEALDTGRLVALSWSAGGQAQRENVSDTLPALDWLHRPLHVFDIVLDGQSLRSGWSWVGAEKRAGPRGAVVESVIHLRHTLRPVDLDVVTAMDGTSALARRLEITNTGATAVPLSALDPWCGVLWELESAAGRGLPGRFVPNPSAAEKGCAPFRVGYLASDTWGLEGDLVWQGLDRDTLKIERTAQGRTHGPPYFILRNEITGEVAFLALAYSGPWAAELCCHTGPHLSFRLGVAGPSPLRVLDPGERYVSPAVHIGLWHGDMDHSVRDWHAHLRASVVPPRPERKRMYTMAARVVEEPGDWILREIDIAAAMGVESFMVDAGWYGEKFASWWEQRGDWTEGAWLPGGMAGIRDRVHGKGMLFGLWHEAEGVSPASRLYAAHPDWLVKTLEGRVCAPTLDLAHPDAAAFVEESVLRILREHKPDFYKIDYNVSVGEGGQRLHAGYSESSFLRHYERLYAIYDRVRALHPDLCLENCAGGGGRNDLGMAGRFHYSCESDWSVFPYSIRAINTMTLFLPPECLCYYHNHITHAHQTADLDTHLRVTLFALPIYVGFGAQDADLEGEYFRRTRRYIDLHKGFCRPILAGGAVVYHHTPRIGLLGDAPWCVLEYGDTRRERGYVGVFRLGGAGDGHRRLNPRGVDRGKRYRVTLDNEGAVYETTGAELATGGIALRLERPLTSELVLYEAI